MHAKCHFHKIRCSREGNHTTVKTGKQEENTEPSTWTMSDLVSCLLLSKHISKSNAEFSNPPCSAPTGVLQWLASEPGQPPGAQQVWLWRNSSVLGCACSRDPEKPLTLPAFRIHVIHSTPPRQSLRTVKEHSYWPRHVSGTVLSQRMTEFSQNGLSCCLR